MKHSTLMKVAQDVAQESKCVSLNVGAVLVKDGHIISTGYNGTIKGVQNCDQVVGISIAKEEHHEWSKKNEIHAEMNALLHCPVSTQDSIIYVTDSPCFNCTKHLVAAGVKAIYYGQLYHRYLTTMKDEWVEVLDFCSKAGIYLYHLKGDDCIMIAEPDIY